MTEPNSPRNEKTQNKMADRMKLRIRAEDSRFLVNRSPFYQIVRMLARYSARMNAILKPAGLDVPKWRVLMMLSEKKPFTVSELAEEAVVNISTMAKIINRMIADGLVTTQTSTTDARSTEVFITDEGQRLLERVRDKVNYLFKEALRGISKSELQLLNTLSVNIYDNLSP